MAKQKTFDEAFHEALKDIYFAERTSVRALKKAERLLSCQSFGRHSRHMHRRVPINWSGLTKSLRLSESQQGAKPAGPFRA